MMPVICLVISMWLLTAQVNISLLILFRYLRTPLDNTFLGALFVKLLQMLLQSIPKLSTFLLVPEVGAVFGLDTVLSWLV